ncbi:unnamed protein product, partial [Brachionus calyciflorus]
MSFPVINTKTFTIPIGKNNDFLTPKQKRRNVEPYEQPPQKKSRTQLTATYSPIQNITTIDHRNNLFYQNQAFSNFKNQGISPCRPNIEYQFLNNRTPQNNFNSHNNSPHAFNRSLNQNNLIHQSISPCRPNIEYQFLNNRTPQNNFNSHNNSPHSINHSLNQNSFSIHSNHFDSRNKNDLNPQIRRNLTTLLENIDPTNLHGQLSQNDSPPETVQISNPSLDYQNELSPIENPNETETCNVTKKKYKFGSLFHKRISHRECPLNKNKVLLEKNNDIDEVIDSVIANTVLIPSISSSMGFLRTKLPKSRTYLIARKEYNPSNIFGKYVDNNPESKDFGSIVLPQRDIRCKFCSALMWVEEKSEGS